MKKLAIGVALLALLLALSALAWGGYIFEDPIFGIGENVVNVLVAKDVPQGETVSGVTTVYMLVPRNVPARVIDPLGCDARVIPTRPQWGPIRISLAAVRAAETDGGSSYPVRVTVFDDAGYSLSLPGRAGRWVVVPYIQW